MSIRRSGAAGVKRNRYRPRLHGRGLGPCARGAGCAPACAKDGRDLRPRRSLAHACHRNRGCGLFFEKVQGSLRRGRLSSGRCPGHPLWVPELPRHRQADGATPTSRVHDVGASERASRPCTLPRQHAAHRARGFNRSCAGRAGCDRLRSVRKRHPGKRGRPRRRHGGARIVSGGRRQSARSAHHRVCRRARRHDRRRRLRLLPPPSTSRSSRSSRQPTSLTSNRKPISAAKR